MKNFVFYLGLGLLFTHELDAMPNHEWRVIPLLSSLPGSAGQLTFIIAHVPLFAFGIAFIASLNLKIRNTARSIASGFLVAHAILHFLFSNNAAYEFSSLLSALLIYGAALCGVVYFLALQPENRHDGA